MPLSSRPGILPDHAPCESIERIHLMGTSHVHRAISHNRRRLEAKVLHVLDVVAGVRKKLLPDSEVKIESATPLPHQDGFALPERKIDQRDQKAFAQEIKLGDGPGSGDAEDKVQWNRDPSGQQSQPDGRECVWLTKSGEVSG